MSRQLSPIEHVMYLVDQVARQNFVMTARLSGSLNNIEPTIRQALDVIQERFPPLRWKIKEGSPPEFVTEGVPKIPIRSIKRRDEDHWIEVAEDEMEEPFIFNEGPLVRVVLLTSEDKCDLLVTFCHVPTDGISSIMVMRKLLGIVAKLLKGEKIIYEPSLPDPLPVLDALRDDIEFLVENEQRDEDFCQKNDLEVELEPDVDVPVEQRRTRIIQEALTVDETKQLITLCKENKTSVHGVLCAAFFQTIIAQIRKSQDVPQTGPLRISSYSPVNIRHLFTDYREENIGYYIGIAVHSQAIDENEVIWNEAAKVKKSLEAEINSGRYVKILKDVAAALKDFSSPLELARRLNSANAPVVTTNLGRVDMPERFGDLNLDAFYFPGAIHFDAKNGFAIDVGTFRGRLHITYLWVEPYISKKRAREMVDDMLTRIKSILA